MSKPDHLDLVELTGLRAVGHHGVFDFERRDGQEFIVDVALGVDLQIAAVSEKLEDTVHYGIVAEQVHEIITGPAVDLIETLALRIVEACLSHDLVGWARVRVHKPQAPIEVAFSDVTVTMERSRK